MKPDGGFSILFLYDSAAETGDAASRDVFDQIDAAYAALEPTGARLRKFGVGLDLSLLKRELAEKPPYVAFNLVESLDGSDRLQTVVAMLLEEWRIPFTGCGSAAMLLANDKIAGKLHLQRLGLAVPGAAWLRGEKIARIPAGGVSAPGDWIVKAVDAHASVFLDDSSVLRGATAATAARRAAELSRRHGIRFFAEEFIDGREFNISLLEIDGRVRALPAAEIRFDNLPEGSEAIVGYAAKWDEDSPEYRGTVRTFDCGGDGVTGETCRVALEVWEAMGLSGYARVDFRVDAAGRPWVLEVNANPCLAPDAGFAAAAAKAGIGFSALLERILAAALGG